MGELQELNKWGDRPCSRAETLNIIQRSVLPEFIYGSHAICNPSMSLPPSHHGVQTRRPLPPLPPKAQGRTGKAAPGPAERAGGTLAVVQRTAWGCGPGSTAESQGYLPARATSSGAKAWVPAADSRAWGDAVRRTTHSSPPPASGQRTVPGLVGHLVVSAGCFGDTEHK